MDFESCNSVEDCTVSVSFSSPDGKLGGWVIQPEEVNQNNMDHGQGNLLWVKGSVL